MKKVRFEKYVLEYDDGRNYYILPDGRRIIVDHTCDLGNHGWLTLSSLPFEQDLPLIVEPINTTFPLVGIITKDGKTVFIQQSYVTQVNIDGIMTTTEKLPTYDYGILIKPNKKIKLIKISKIYYEIYGVGYDNNVIIMDKVGNIKDEIELVFNPQSMDIDKFETRLFLNDDNNVYILNMHSKEIEGSVSSQDKIIKVLIDQKNDDIVMLHNDGYKILNKELELVKKISTDIPVKDIIIDAVKNDKQFLIHDSKISVYEGTATTPKTIINLPTTNYVTNFYDPVHDKIYVASDDYIITVNPVNNTTLDLKPFQCAKTITGVPYSGDVYIINCQNNIFNIKNPDNVKNIPINNVVAASSDANKIYAVDENGSIFNVNIDTYIPQNLIEINRGQIVTGNNCVTVNINPTELTEVPDKMRIVDGSYETDWFEFSPLVNYCIKDKNNGLKDLTVVITDKNGNEYTVNTPDIFLDSSQPDTRNPDDVTSDLKEELRTFVNPPATVENMRTRLTLDARDVVVRVGNTTDLRAVCYMSNNASYNMTYRARYLVSDATIGMAASGVFTAIKKGDVSVVAYSGDLKSNFVRITVINEGDAEPDKPIYQRLVLEADRYQINVGESINLKATAYYSQGKIFDFTSYVDKYEASDSAVGSISGSVFIANKSGQTDIITFADGLYSNPVTIKVLSGKPQINTTLLLEADKESIQVGETVNLKASWLLSNGVKYDMTDNVNYVYDSSIGLIQGGIFTGSNKGDTAVMVNIGDARSNSIRIIVLGDGESINTLPEPVLMTAILEAERYKVLVGQSVKLKVTGNFTDKSNQDITSSVNQYNVYNSKAGQVGNSVFTGAEVGSTGIVAVIPPMFSMPINIKVYATEEEMEQEETVTETTRSIGVPAGVVGGIGTAGGLDAAGEINADLIDDYQAPGFGGIFSPTPPNPRKSSQDSGADQAKSYAERKKDALKIPDVSAMNIYTGVEDLDTVVPHALVIHKPVQESFGDFFDPPDKVTAPVTLDEIKYTSPAWDTVVVDKIAFLHTDSGLDMEGGAKLGIEIPDAEQYHRFHMLDAITIFLKGPKQNYSEMQQLVNGGQPNETGAYASPNVPSSRDPIMAMFRDENYFEERRLSESGKSYYLYSDKVHFDGMNEPSVTSLVDKFNHDATLKTLVRNASMKYKIEADILISLMIHLSGLNYNLVRRTHITRIGLMQITQSMARENGDTTNINKLLEPTKNIDVACYFINKHRNDTRMDPVKVALIYGVGKITPMDNMEWGVKEPYDGYMSGFINVYNSVLLAERTNKLNI